MIRALLMMLALAGAAAAQDFTGLARVDVAQSRMIDTGTDVQIDLALSQTVPYRVFTLDDPRRLVVDFREVDWTGVDPEALRRSDRISDLRFGTLRPGWSRMVADLDAPLNVRLAGMKVSRSDGTALVSIVLTPVTPEDFGARAGAPPLADWDALTASDPTAALPDKPNGPLIVMIDPGHGGIDPGAMRDDLVEAELMLQLGFEVADALNRSPGIRALMTREADVFVPLEERMTLARAARADLFLSLHADALEEDDATAGASVYVLSEEGIDNAARRIAERHDRGDLLAGVDLTAQDDRVATVLMDMARLESSPQGARFADRLIDALTESGARVNSTPRRAGALSVLHAADFPSVLLEAGFLSNARDRATLASAEGRARIVVAITNAVQRWAQDEAVRAPFVRQ